MLIIPAELAKKIDENRRDMAQAELINFLIDSQLKKVTKEPQYATKEEVHSLEQAMKKLLKNFIDFFVNWGIELTRQVMQNTPPAKSLC